MLEKNVIKKVLGKALSTGGDFSEMFVEDSINNNILMINGNIDSAVSGREFGIGIRIFKGFKSVYAYTNDKSLKGMLETAYKASCAIGELKEHMLVQTQLLGAFH